MSVEREPLITDERLARVEGRLRAEFRLLPEDASLVTYWQESFEAAKEGTDEPFLVPKLAVLAVMSTNPRHPTHDTMTLGSMRFEDWAFEERTFKHFVGVEDPALKLYRPIVRRHIDTIENLKAMN